MAKIAGFVFFVTILLAFSCGGQRSWATSVGVEVVGTEFHLSTGDGRTLRSAELIGAILTVATNGTTVRVRVDGVEPDPGDPARGYKPAADVWLYTFSVQQADGSWINLCEPGPDGRRQGFPLAGVARADGTIAPAEPGQFVLTCTGGAEGKCIRFGYRPWDKAPDGQSLAEAYQTCVHLVRADYAGDGTATTRNGQPIDIYDSLGVQAPANDPGQDFEAGWGPDGAVCVRHVRVKENVTLEAIAAHTPRLNRRVGPICTEEYARSLGAILFSRSPP
ncbi:MAG: ADYC domain-containing protein [Ancalomicrobiaceae bacterium]|nr:ADYC domain-containing protein [Ancalomicrobiaceae bacterium]